MSMTDRYDVVSSRKDKDGKWRSIRIGAAFPKGDRFNIVLDALPMPNAEGQAWLTLFPAKEKEAGQDAPAERKPASAKTPVDMDDEIPF
jgi:hypothetical protein